MNKQLQIVLLVGLVASAYSQPYYWSTVNICPLGQYPSDCTSGSNYYSMSTTTSATPVNQTCSVCPKGTATFGSSMSYNNYYMNYYGSCQTCSWGYYANKTGQTFCNECPEGSICPNPSEDPYLCPKGFSCSKVWNIDNQNYYYYYGMSGAKGCQQGTYANKRGQAYCTSCPTGYSCADPTAAPVACPKGTASNPYGGYSMYSSGCQSCQQGTYQPNLASASCGVCPEGYYCPIPTLAKACPPGSFRNNYIKVTFPRKSDDSNNYWYVQPGTKCIRCPAGYYATSAGSKICIKCPRGYYCSDPTVAPKPCPAGTFSNLEYGIQSCMVCPDGSYTTTIASKTCTMCPKGYYCADPSKAPAKCPIGTFSNSTVGQLLCTPCPPGTYAATTGSTQCTPCPMGKCCNDPTLSPQPCYF